VQFGPPNYTFSDGGPGPTIFSYSGTATVYEMTEITVTGVALSLSELVGTTEIVSAVVTVDSRFAIRVSGCRSTKTVLVTTYRQETPLI
jgi:hypothetical protein